MAHLASPTGCVDQTRHLTNLSDQVPVAPSAAEALIALADALELQLDELIEHVEVLKHKWRRAEAMHQGDVRLARLRSNASDGASATSGSSRS